MEKISLEQRFTKLVLENERIIFKLCYLYADNEADRQDLYQDIVLNIWQAYPKFRGEAKFSTWLYQVGINTSLSFLKGKKRHIEKHPGASQLSDWTDHIQDQQSAEKHEMLEKAIGHLSEIEKAIVMLYLENKSYDEMETIMGISNGALRVKMLRIKEKLKNITKMK